VKFKYFILIFQVFFFISCCSDNKEISKNSLLVRSDPVKYDGLNNITISNLQISNLSGHCIQLSNCSDIIIRNCNLGPSLGEGVFVYNCSNITIMNCYIHTVESGIVADTCTGIKVLGNRVKNVNGPMPRGQMVQFGNVTGIGNRINYNIGENIPGQSNPEDEISLYRSSGTVSDPIQVIGNWIRGGGPSTSGGGIMTGDEGGAYIIVADNILVNPGQYGITIASGHDITIRNNKIFGKQQKFSNVGLSAYRQYPINTYAISIMDNEVNFTNKDGELNNFWNSETCGTVNGWNTNKYNANLSESILENNIIGNIQ